MLNFNIGVLTEEEKERNKQEEKERLSKLGYLPFDDDYMSIMRESQEEIEKNPEKYIIPECLPACKELWSKNIYTFMVSDHLNEGVSWIEVLTDALSDENKEIFFQLEKMGARVWSYHPGALNFEVNGVGKHAQEHLLELAKQFKMQDVPIEQAYISPEKFLINYCNCYSKVDNPNYIEMKYPFDDELVVDDLSDYLKKYDEWEKSDRSKKELKIFDKNKMQKSLDEYASEHGMIAEGDRVYLSKFHYEKHKKYIQYVNNNFIQESGGNARH